MNPRLVTWCALLAAALLLRAWGLDYGSPPTLNHPDESNYAGIAGQLSWGQLNPGFFENPPLMTYVLFAGREARALVLGREADRAWIADGGLVRLGRWLSVLLGVATVALVGGTASRLLRSPGAGLAAGAIVACSFLHGRDSHYGVNDVPTVAFVALALDAASRAWRQGSRAWLWASAAAAGLAISMKYSGGAAIAAPLAVVALGPGSRLARLRDAVAVGLVAGLACLASDPWPLLDPQEFARDLHAESQWGESRIIGQAYRPNWSLYAESTLAMLGLAHAAAAAVGLALLVRRDPRVALILLAAPALYLAVMLQQVLFFWRYVLPLLPFLAVAAAAAWSELARRLAPRRPQLALAALVVVGSAQPAAALLRHDVLASRPCTWLLARDWILEHVPEGESLYLAGAFPPRLPNGRYRIVRPDVPVAPGGRLWVATNAWFEASWRVEMTSENPARIFQRLHETLQPVAEFTPGPAGDPPFVVDALYSPLTDLWSIDRGGFTIRVYRVEPEDWARLLAR